VILPLLQISFLTDRAEPWSAGLQVRDEGYSRGTYPVSHRERKELLESIIGAEDQIAYPIRGIIPFKISAGNIPGVGQRKKLEKFC
jgi:hypothetical protein